MRTKTKESQISRQKAVINYQLLKPNAKLIEDNELFKIITYNTENRRGVFPALACFVGRSSKPALNFYYNNVFKRNVAIEKFKRDIFSRNEAKLKKRIERANFQTSCKVGDIFVCSWGYEQTNIDFYKLIDLQKNFGTFVEIGQNIVDGSMMEHGMACDVVPDPDVVISEPFKKQILSGETIHLASYKYCLKHDGKPEHKSWYA